MPSAPQRSAIVIEAARKGGSQGGMTRGYRSDRLD
jgi:hypothetical protein